MRKALGIGVKQLLVAKPCQRRARGSVERSAAVLALVALEAVVDATTHKARALAVRAFMGLVLGKCRGRLGLLGWLTWRRTAKGCRKSLPLQVSEHGAGIAHTLQQCLELSVFHRCRPAKTGEVEAKVFLN